MTNLEIWLLAISLAMDCFSVSITSGIILRRVCWKTFLTIGFFFGLFQAMMPLMGCLDYLSVKQALEKAPENASIVMMMDGYVQHFEKFSDNENILTALGGYLAGVVDLLAGRL